MEIASDKLDIFKPRSLTSDVDNHDGSPLAKSIVISEYFKSLSLYFGRVIPGLLAKHISSQSFSDEDEAQVKQLHSLMSEVVRLTDAEGLFAFFSKTIIPLVESLPTDSSQQYKALVEYIANEMCDNLSHATHLDVNDLVTTLKRRVLSEFVELTQMFHNDFDEGNQFIDFLKTQQCHRYEWICTLTSKQDDINQYLKIGKERSLSESEKVGLAQLLELKSLSDDRVKDALKYLERYGVIKCKKKGPSNHSIIIIRAGNLSLHDIANESGWLDCNEFKEVQFMCTNCFYVDASICEVKLKNVAIAASKVVVLPDELGKKREITVSGSDGASFHGLCAKDGASPGAHGINGRDGEPGESGGNIMICADVIENSELLALNTNGGRGGSGQDGGDGRNGEATQSKSDDLELFGGYESMQIIKKSYVGVFEKSYTSVKTVNDSHAYGKLYDEVKVLHGRNWLDTYGFMYSRGVNGVSADGGNAGRGGKAAKGGSAGNVDILMKNGIDRNHSHQVSISANDGAGGEAGNPGKPGKKDLAESRKDYLVVDGFWKSVLRYDGFIDAKPYKGNNSSRLERGWYYCDPSVAQCFDPNMKDGYIEFFKVERPSSCPTKYKSHATDGEEHSKEEEMILSTPCKPINKAELQIEYQVFSSEHLQVQGSLSLLEETEQKLRENLEELETTYVNQQFKQILRHDNLSLGHSLEDHGHEHSLSTLLINDSEKTDTFLFVEKVTRIIANLFNHDQRSKKILTELEESSMQQKYSMLKDIIEHNLAIERQWEENRDMSLPEVEVCDLICQLMEVVFHPNFLIHLDRNTSLQHVSSLFNSAEKLFQTVDFASRVMQMKQYIKPRYEWSILAVAHQRLLDACSYTDKKFQGTAVAIYLKICSQDSIENIDKEFAQCFQNQHGQNPALQIYPFKKSLNKFKTSCDATLPLLSQTKSALEILMVFINEANEKSYGNFHFPDLLEAIEREYLAYRRTIDDADLMFVMTYIQDKLGQLLLDRTQLEDMFCDKFQSKKNELRSYIGGVIINENTLYKVIDVDSSSEHNKVIIKTAETNRRIFQKKHKFKINLKTLQVTIDETPVIVPQALLISKLDIESLWTKIEQTFMKDDKPEELEKFLDTFNFPQNEDRHLLTEMLQQARWAQDTQFDVFAFQPPSQWVEKLILSTVRYKICDSDFASQIAERIDGLSQCCDKSLYCNLLTQFLQEPSSQDDSFKVELLEALEHMRFIFIDQNLSSLVTLQGLTRSGIEEADYIFDDLIDLEIIDFIGIFLSTTTEETIKFYCNSREVDTVFLRTVYFLQKSIGQLSGKELSFWNHKLGELCLRLSLLQLTDGDIEMCDTLLAHTYQMQRFYGEQQIIYFIQLICTQNHSDVSTDKMLNLFSKCSCKEWIFSIVYQTMKQTFNGERNDSTVSPLLQALNDLDSFEWDVYRQNERKVQEIIDGIVSQHQLLKDSEHIIPILESIKKEVDDIKMKEKCKSQLYFQIDDDQLQQELNPLPICEYSQDDIAHWAAKFKENVSRKDFVESSCRIEAFAVIRRAITLFYETEKKTKGVFPRDTQMVSSLLFFHDLSAQGSAQGTKLLQQISTGEGKTMILGMAAIYKVLLGEKVDIVTSSSVLATRDAVDQKPFYDMFNITVSHCCHDDIAKRRKAYEADIIYGDIGSFQRDILETEFYERKIRTDRHFDNVFVDEVDSMLVDKGENMLYLPHALPDMNCLDQIYLEIWSLVNAKDFLGFEHEQEDLYLGLRRNLLGAIAPNAFTAISGVSEKLSSEIFEYLVSEKIINSDDHCVLTKSFDKLKSCVEVCTSIRDSHTRNEVLLVILQHVEAKPLIQKIPKALHSFVKKSLRSWIHSAVCAKLFHPNKQYVIDIDRTESASDRYPKIIIMDNETGVEQESSEWGSGLHQFLQLKHNLRLSNESLKAVYMSNISFFIKHKNIMGVTGTLGSEEEHALFKKLYGDILIVEIPTNRPSNMNTELPMCYSQKHEWENAVYLDVKEKLKDRVVLLICEDVEEARSLEQFLNKKLETSLNKTPLLYFSSHQEKLDARDKFEPGQLIIATNLAGRGTDIKLTNAVVLKGGLHVCLSYLPPNVRVELQAYGRCARSGEPGSSKMIFYNKDGDLDYAIRKRDLSEANRVSEIEADYFHNITFQERLFKKFSELYSQVKVKYSNKEHRGVLDYCLDCWAFFLDHYTKAIESIPKKSSLEAKREKKHIMQTFEREVQTVMEKLNNISLDKLPFNLSLSRLVQLGHTFMKQEVKRGNDFKGAGNKTDFKLAVDFYKQAAAVSSNDPFPKYYLVAAELNQTFLNKIGKGEEERRALKQAYYKLIPLFQNKIRQCQDQSVMLQLANRHQDQTITGNVQYFQEQKQHEIEIYQQFISSMQVVTGREITHNLFDHVDWGEIGGKIVFRIVCKEFSLKDPYIAKNYSDRLDSLLQSNKSYYTFEAKIRDRVRSLRGKTGLNEDDFDGVLPDKREFWSLLKKHCLITRETKKLPEVDDDFKDIPQREEVTGYLNPTIDVEELLLEAWDCIDVHSFDWIEGLTQEKKSEIFTLLKREHILNSRGQLESLNLAKPLELPLQDSCVKYYKAVKDTLWHHTIYRFVVDHLRESAEIDVSSDVSGFMDEKIDTMQISAVNILISLHESTMSSEAIERNTQLFDPDVSESHFRNHEFAQQPSDKEFAAFAQQLFDNNLIPTQVSGSAFNCMINAMIQHAKKDYITLDFPETTSIRKTIQQNHPHSDLSGIQHCDNEIASEVLSLVNNNFHSDIEKVFVFIASTDGPILCREIIDKRSSTTRCVALWQQGSHFVAVVHRQEFINSRYEVESESSVSIDVDESAYVITTSQLNKLKELGIIMETKSKGKYRICKSLEEIECILRTDPELIKFLTLKLEVDYKTLCNSPRLLVSGQSQMLHDDLCLYTVIKPLKMKKTSNDIGEKCRILQTEDRSRSDVDDALCCTFKSIPIYFDITVLNHYLELKEVQQLTLEQYEELRTLLISERSYHLLHSIPTRDLQSALSVIHPKLLSPSQKSEVQNFVLLMIQLKTNSTFIMTTLQSQQSTLLELDNPQISLRRLADLFEDLDSLQDKRDVLGWFTENQCDLIIHLAEQKWSWKTILTALSITVIGVAQIALGAVLLMASGGSGAFICKGLISEGVSDMIFGIEGLVRGHCNWSQYYSHKKMSVAITIATAGIGAYLAKGTKASEYAYKAFGNSSMELAKSTAKQTGKGLGKVMAKQVTKKIAKKVVGAAVDAGINLACDRVVEEMSQSIDGLSECIINSFDSMTKDEAFREEVTFFLKRQDPERAQTYMHQIFTRVMQQKTFLEIWDSIESKVQKGANVMIQAHGNASKHLQMANKTIRCKGLMKCVGYASRFGPIISESIKIGSVKEKMSLLKEELIQELKQHQDTIKQGQVPLDEETCKETLKMELKEVKQYLSWEVSQRGRTIATTGLQMMAQELKNCTIVLGKEITTHIKEHIDMMMLKKYEHEALEAHAEDNHSKVREYEHKMKRLMSFTRNPDVFAHLIEHHDVQLGPAFAIPALESILNRPIKLVNENGEPLLNVQAQHVSGPELKIQFIPGKSSMPGHFKVGDESFSVDQLGNDCLIHAAMKAAGQTDYVASDVRKEIASKCRERSHPCNQYIRTGIARNYVEIGLIGGNRPAWWCMRTLFPFLLRIAFRQMVQKIPYLQKCTRLCLKGTKGLREMKLDICHIVSWNNIKTFVRDALKTINPNKLRQLRSALLPTTSEVETGISIFGDSEGKEVFLQEYGNNSQYMKGVKKVQDIIYSFSESEKMSAGDLKKLYYYMHGAPANLRLGDAKLNRKIKEAMDYCDTETRSVKLYQQFKDFKHFTKPKKDETGKMMTSYHVHAETQVQEELATKPPSK